jgi:hypothetical protein
MFDITVLKIIGGAMYNVDYIGNHAFSTFSVVCVFVGMGMCLPSHCLSTEVA